MSLLNWLNSCKIQQRWIPIQRGPFLNSKVGCLQSPIFSPLRMSLSLLNRCKKKSCPGWTRCLDLRICGLHLLGCLGIGSPWTWMNFDLENVFNWCKLNKHKHCLLHEPCLFFFLCLFVCLVFISGVNQPTSNLAWCPWMTGSVGSDYEALWATKGTDRMGVEGFSNVDRISAKNPKDVWNSSEHFFLIPSLKQT